MTTTDIIVAFIQQFEREHGVTPTYREIVAGVDAVSSTSVVKFHVDKLRREGRVDQVGRRWRLKEAA